MEQNLFKVGESVIYRAVANELVVIDTETGKFFHFSLSTRTMLDFFREPHSANSFLESSELEEKDRELAYLNDLCGRLTDHRILQRVPSAERPEQSVHSHSPYVRPELLKEGHLKLDDVAFLYP